MLRKLVFSIWSYAVRSAIHHEWIWTLVGQAAEFRNVDRREEPLPVTHRNAEFILGIVRGYELRRRRLWRNSCFLRAKKNDRDKQKHQGSEGKSPRYIHSRWILLNLGLVRGSSNSVNHTALSGSNRWSL